jgi:hypothetical protein
MEIVPNRAQDIIRLHDEAGRHCEGFLDKAWQCGRLLLDQSHECEHGTFQDWIAANVPCISYMQAWKYMQVAKLSREKLLQFGSIRKALMASGKAVAEPKEVRDASEDMDALLDLAGILGTKWKQWENMFERMLPSASDEWLAEQAQLLRGPHDRYEQIKKRLTA